MTQTWEEWKKENNFSADFSEEVLKQALLCRGKAVVLTAIFNERSKQKNKLIFKSIRPYIEIMPYRKTKMVQKKICDKLTFPADVLWKVRILQTAGKSERFYILGYFKLVYENRHPVGKLILAEDIIPCPIMTESRFMDCYYRFRDRCYKWPKPDGIRVEISAVMQKENRKLLLMRSLPGKQVYLIQVIKRQKGVHRITEAWEKNRAAALREAKEKSRTLNNSRIMSVNENELKQKAARHQIQ